MKVVHILGRGLVGQALARHFAARYHVVWPSRELDLTDPRAIASFAASTPGDFAILAAGKVGGIVANQERPADFGYINGIITLNVLNAYHQTGIKLLYLGSACTYPLHSPQPMRPEHLLTGPVEPTNEPYALAKILGIRLCAAYRKQYGDNFISCQPASLYGPADNFHPTDSHVIPALIRKVHASLPDRHVFCFGSGNAIREFLHVDDFAAAAEALLLQYDGAEPVNVAPGAGTTIRDLVIMIRDSLGHTGTVFWDVRAPEGQYSRLLDTSVINAMWKPHISLSQGIASTVEWFRANPWCLQRRY